MGKLIAVDFDDTVTLYSPYPITGELNPDAKKYLDLLSEKGYRLILWTARSGTAYDEAVKLVRYWELPLDIDGPQEYHGSTGKIGVDFYIDDRALLRNRKRKGLNWKKIYRYIIKNIV